MQFIITYYILKLFYELMIYLMGIIFFLHIFPDKVFFRRCCRSFFFLFTLCTAKTDSLTTIVGIFPVMLAARRWLAYSFHNLFHDDPYYSLNNKKPYFRYHNIHIAVNFAKWSNNHVQA